jgi:rhodanese-related sulfurtransferase
MDLRDSLHFAGVLPLSVEWYDLCIEMQFVERGTATRSCHKVLYSGWRDAMKTVTTEDLKALKDQNGELTLVNTLAAEAFQKTKIPGAINIPLESNDFVARVEQAAGGKHKPVVVYCASKQCDSSEKAARKLESVGFTDVSRYTDGAAAWQQEPEEVASGQCC